MTYFTPYLLIFIAGVAGSLHCIGMCGGFACAIGPDVRGPTATLRRHLIYNLGRVTTYCFIGGLVGYLGMQFMHSLEGTPLVIAQRVLATVAGALMIFVGMQFFGFAKTKQHALNGLGSQILSQALRDLLKHPSPLAPLAFGVLNGFLPCPLVYAFAAQAAASGGTLPGILTMAVFGLGTLAAMLAMGGVGAIFHIQTQTAQVQTVPMLQLGREHNGNWLQANWRLHGLHICGAFILLLGIITIARGALPLAPHTHPL